MMGEPPSFLAFPEALGTLLTQEHYSKTLWQKGEKQLDLVLIVKV